MNVLYAGSLVHIMEQQLGPAFDKQSGYTFVGFAAGSTELANDIKGGVRQGDVFVSASSSSDALLQGPANGAWVSWYASFARAPLVLGYDPHSRFAAQLRSMPWYDVITETGFLLGRTDPVLDPKGKLTTEALQQAAASTGKQGLLQLASDPSTVFPEETLLGRLAAGQLDAGFFYSDEAAAAGIPVVPLAPVSLAATFTVAPLQRAQNAAAALAFVEYLLGPSARPVLQRDGFVILSPAPLQGSGVPAALSHLVE